LVQQTQYISKKAANIRPIPKFTGFSQLLTLEQPVNHPENWGLYPDIDDIPKHLIRNNKPYSKPNIRLPSDSQITLKVLTIIYDTHLQNGGDYHPPEELNVMLADRLEWASVEQGYSNSGNPPNLDIVFTDTITYTSSLPQIPDCVPGGQTICADYHSIIYQHNICTLLNNGDLDEVWIWADQTGSLAESLMVGPEDQIFPTNGYALPRPDCFSLFHIMGFNYERYMDVNDHTGEVLFPSVGFPMHNFSHRIENTISHYLDQKNRKTVEPGDNWYEYDTKQGYNSDYNWEGSSCGNTHWTVNSTDITNEYDYSLVQFKSSDCNFWNPQHNSDTSTLNCSQWGCFQEPYMIWWMQNMPGMCNSFGMSRVSGDPMPNWWKLIFDYEVDIEQFKCGIPTLAEFTGIVVDPLGNVYRPQGTPACGFSNEASFNLTCTSSNCSQADPTWECLNNNIYYKYQVIHGDTSVVLNPPTLQPCIGWKVIDPYTGYIYQQGSGCNATFVVPPENNSRKLIFTIAQASTPTPTPSPDPGCWVCDPYNLQCFEGPPCMFSSLNMCEDACN